MLLIDEAQAIRGKHPWSAIARVRTPGTGREGEMLLYDALVNDSFCRQLVTAIGSNGVFRGKRGNIVTASTSLFQSLAREESLRSPKLLQAEQTNSSIAYGDRLIFKLFRQIEDGINPEVEIGRMLTERTGFHNRVKFGIKRRKVQLPDHHGWVALKNPPELKNAAMRTGEAPSEPRHDAPTSRAV